MKIPKALIYILILLILIITAFIAFSTGAHRDPSFLGSGLNPDTNRTRNAGISPQADKGVNRDQVYAEDPEKLTLNFKDKQVVFTGYPLVAKDYIKIFHYIYVNTGQSEDMFIDRETGIDQMGSYSYGSMTAENRIYAGVGRSPDDKPIKQTMEIITAPTLSRLLEGCKSSVFDINGIQATKYDCSGISDYADFSNSHPCYVPVDGTSGILYRQYSVDVRVSGDMCENLAKNGIRSVEYLAY